MGILKVLWICHFTNAEIQSKLSFWKNKDELSPWVPNMIKGFEDRNDIEIHVISPQEYLKKQTSYTNKNIHYHFIPYGIPFYHRHWPGVFRYDIYTNFAGFRKKVKKLIKKLQPDLINLIGAENAYYSSSILDYKDKYPILITIQGFISQMKDSIKLTPIQCKRIEIEESILKTFNYYCGEQDSSTYIDTYNPSHQFYKLYFPVNESLAFKTREQNKRYDCIYYGRLVKIKGAEDFVRVISELKKTIPNIKACIIGGGDEFPIKTLAKKLNCFQNIEFKGFLSTQEELFEHVKASKVFLTPPLFERLSMTIRETMYLKVPIVAYATGGIPYINELDENILMVKTGDYKAMAEKTLYLLQNDTERNELAEKSYLYAQNEYSLKVNSQRLIDAYRQIIINS